MSLLQPAAARKAPVRTPVSPLGAFPLRRGRRRRMGRPWRQGRERQTAGDRKGASTNSVRWCVWGGRWWGGSEATLPRRPGPCRPCVGAMVTEGGSKGGTRYAGHRGFATSLRCVFAFCFCFSAVAASSEAVRGSRASGIPGRISVRREVIPDGVSDIFMGGKAGHAIVNDGWWVELC